MQYYRDHLENGAAVYRNSDYIDDPEERNRFCCACFENQKDSYAPAGS